MHVQSIYFVYNTTSVYAPGCVIIWMLLARINFEYDTSLSHRLQCLNTQRKIQIEQTQNTRPKISRLMSHPDTCLDLSIQYIMVYYFNFEPFKVCISTFIQEFFGLNSLI